MRFPRPSRRTWLRLGFAAAALVVAAALPVVWNETRCMSAPQPLARPASLLAPADHRDEINSYLTYPEWSVVHAYEDLAAVTRTGSESDYDYFDSIGRYWSSLCSISRLASARGTISGEYKAMLYIVGLSFAAEMGIKGIYEKTIGRLTAWIRGAKRTPEDEFALKLADDYAAFLRQTPWYEFPFASRLVQFWRETPVFRGNVIRKLERRVALTLEWGGKAVYARLIGIAAAASPAPLRIKSVLAGRADEALKGDPRIKIIEERDGATIVETDRYRTFTEIVLSLAAKGRDFREIAGNRNVLVTLLAQNPTGIDAAGAAHLFSVPVRGRPGWTRHAYDVKIPDLTRLVRNLAASSLTLEHIYDY